MRYSWRCQLPFRIRCPHDSQVKSPNLKGFMAQVFLRLMTHFFSLHLKNGESSIELEDEDFSV